MIERIYARCDTCGDWVEGPDKGLWRAYVAAWKTRHQHDAITPETCPEREYHGKPFRYCPVKGCGWIEPR